jgi:hypothetical protein
LKTFTPQPGDIGFAWTQNPYGALIRFAQALRWWNWRKWNHMFVVQEIDETGQIWVLQMARRCERVRIEDVAPKGHVKIVQCPDDLDRDRVMAWANKRVGTKYGVLTIVSIAFNLCLPNSLRVDIHKEDTLICSTFAARAWEHGGWDCPTDPFQIIPAEYDRLVDGLPCIQVY